MSEDIRPYRSFYRRKARIDVYIVSKEQADRMEAVGNGCDVIVVDDRASPDPNMQVRQSYKITHRADRAAIVRILLEFNGQYPEHNRWNRTFSSMMREWVLHNVAYRMGVQPKRTGDVDFNNGDEEKGLLDYIGGL